MDILLGENQAEPLGGEGGLVLALDLDRDGLANEQLAGRLLVDAVQREMAAHALAGLDRGEEADAVEAVVDAPSWSVSGISMTSAAMRLSSDSDRKPWAIVPPKPAAAAAAGSTWMN